MRLYPSLLHYIAPPPHTIIPTNPPRKLLGQSRETRAKEPSALPSLSDSCLLRLLRPPLHQQRPRSWQPSWESGQEGGEGNRSPRATLQVNVWAGGLPSLPERRGRAGARGNRGAARSEGKATTRARQAAGEPLSSFPPGLAQARGSAK